MAKDGDAEKRFKQRHNCKCRANSASISKAELVHLMNKGKAIAL